MDSLHHLVRRGIEQAQDFSGNANIDIDMDAVLVQVPKWAFALFALTALTYICVYISIAYTYGTLLPLLSMVETATALPLIRTIPPPAYSAYHDEADADVKRTDSDMDSKDRASFDEAAKEAAPGDVEVLLAPQSFITASVRRTVRHLRAVTGSKLSRFHGLRAVAFYAVLSHLPLALVGGDPYSPLRAIVRVLTAGLLSTVSTAVVHQMIAAPGTAVSADGTLSPHRRNLFAHVRAARRAGAFRTTALPHMAVTAGAVALFAAPRAVSALLHAAQQAVPGMAWTRAWDAALVLSVAGTAVALLAALVPAHIALVRLQASLLPADVDPVVPFDRSLGGRQVRDMRAAWASFDRAGVLRVLVVYLKFVAMEAAVSVLFVGLLVAQLVLFAGPAVREAVRQAREQGMEV